MAHVKIHVMINQIINFAIEIIMKDIWNICLMLSITSGCASNTEYLSNISTTWWQFPICSWPEHNYCIRFRIRFTFVLIKAIPSRGLSSNCWASLKIRSWSLLMSCLLACSCLCKSHFLSWSMGSVQFFKPLAPGSMHPIFFTFKYS